MNYKLVFSTVLKVVKLESALMLLPLLTSLIYKENCFYAFLITIVVSFTLAHVIEKFIKPTSKYFYSKDGFITVALTWTVVSLVGAVPFVLSGEIPSFIDAFFEMVSGFTTTGASILQNVEALSKGLLMWRSFSHFIGGMGVLVFIMAITSKTTDRPIHILRAEMPGPMVSKLVPKSKDTAKILYLMYIVLTIVLVIFLLLGGMNLFDSLVHAFGTAGTGGFSSQNASIAKYNDYIQWVIAIFMLLFGVNFNIYYFLIVKRTFSVLKSSELRTYFLIVITAIIAISINIFPLYQNVYETIKYSVFQVSSIMTTTGYATVNFDVWPEFSKAILIGLMIIGGCSGSTAGGIKVSRIVLAFKKIKAELKKLLYPNTVSVIKFEGEKVDDNVSSGVSAYFTLYFICFITLTLLVATNGFNFETTFSAVSACFNNVGPGINLVGPASNYSCFNGFSKIILSIAMLLGRLEIYPLLLALIPSTWVKSKL